MPLLGDPIQAALALKRRRRYPPDLFNGHDNLMVGVPQSGPQIDAVRNDWQALIRNQLVPMVGERGYYEELPWDE